MYAMSKVIPATKRDIHQHQYHIEIRYGITNSDKVVWFLQNSYFNWYFLTTNLKLAIHHLSGLHV